MQEVVNAIGFNIGTPGIPVLDSIAQPKVIKVTRYNNKKAVNQLTKKIIYSEKLKPGCAIIFEHCDYKGWA